MACQSGELIGLEGMPGVGKTSLVHQVVNRLSESIVATVDLRDIPDADLYLAIRKLWQEQAEGNDPRLVFPSPDNPLEEPDEQQIQDDLAALMEKLSPQTQLVAVVEGVEELPAKSAVSRLASAIGREERASLLVVFNTYPRHAVPHPVLPLVLLDAATSAQMVYSLSGRMALEFSPEAVEDLYQASGGHPLILRQLASLSIVQKRSLDRLVTVADVREAVTEYVGQTDSALGNLWESLTEEEQRALWAALGKAPAADSPGRLYDLGWLPPKNGQLACFSGALAQWLTAQPPPDP
jgi:Cdc6-like AAA superfamily ATPase